MIPQAYGNEPVLFFDGVCNLCNRAVQFIIKHDPGAKIKFATLQSEQGIAAKKAIEAALGSVPDSLIFFDGSEYYAQSRAALKIAGYLNGAWPLLKAFLIVPAFIRDPVYRLIAANRYRWFGKQASCMMPTPELKKRFLQ